MWYYDKILSWVNFWYECKLNWQRKTIVTSCSFEYWLYEICKFYQEVGVLSWIILEYDDKNNR